MTTTLDIDTDLLHRLEATTGEEGADAVHLAMTVACELDNATEVYEWATEDNR